MLTRNFDRRIFLTMLTIMIGAMVPSILLITTELTGALLPSVLIGLALYFIFFRKDNRKEVRDNEEAL